MKNKLTKTILGGLSSLLICGAPMSYASNVNTTVDLSTGYVGGETEEGHLAAIESGLQGIARDQDNPNDVQEFVDRGAAFNRLKELIGRLYSDLTARGYDEQDLAGLRFTSRSGNVSRTLREYFENMLNNHTVASRLEELGERKTIPVFVAISRNGEDRMLIGYRFKYLWYFHSSGYRLNHVCQGATLV